MNRGARLEILSWVFVAWQLKFLFVELMFKILKLFLKGLFEDFCTKKENHLMNFLF